LKPGVVAANRVGSRFVHRVDEAAFDAIEDWLYAYAPISTSDWQLNAPTLHVKEIV